MQAIQVIQKLPRQALASGAIMPVVLEQITFANTVIEITGPPFCLICEKYVINNQCGQEIPPKYYCPIERK